MRKETAAKVLVVAGLLTLPFGISGGTADVPDTLISNTPPFSLYLWPDSLVNAGIFINLGIFMLGGILVAAGIALFRGAGRYAALGLALGLPLFAFFVPVVYVPPHTQCYFGCPPEGQYGSLTYLLLGHGGYFAGMLPSGHYYVC